MDPSIDVGVVYGACRERVVALVQAVDAADLATPVPACPGWSVHDVVAHLAGTVADVTAGKLEGVGTDEWTAAQVDARRGVPLADVVAEWQASAAQFEDGLRLIGGAIADLAIADIWNHEQDMRGALDLDGGRDTAAELCAIDGYAGGKAFAVTDAGLTALRCVAGTHTVTIGEGEPAAEVTAEPFEIARALAGRRTSEQITGYRWEGDAAPYVTILAAGGPTTPLPR